MQELLLVLSGITSYSLACQLRGTVHFLATQTNWQEIHEVTNAGKVNPSSSLISIHRMTVDVKHNC